MRRMLSGLAVGLAVAGGAAAITGGAQAQPYGYYTSPTADYGYRYAPPRAYDADGRYTPYAYPNGYDGYNGYNAYGAGGAVLGALIAPEVLGHAAYDQYGPDYNGMLAADGHVLKCKLVDRSDYYQRYAKRRECR